jgi:hypothetical protein
MVEPGYEKYMKTFTIFHYVLELVSFWVWSSHSVPRMHKGDLLFQKEGGVRLSM